MEKKVASVSADGPPQKREWLGPLLPRLRLAVLRYLDLNEVAGVRFVNKSARALCAEYCERLDTFDDNRASAAVLTQLLRFAASLSYLDALPVKAEQWARFTKQFGPKDDDEDLPARDALAHLISRNRGTLCALPHQLSMHALKQAARCPHLRAIRRGWLAQDDDVKDGTAGQRQAAVAALVRDCTELERLELAAESGVPPAFVTKLAAERPMRELDLSGIGPQHLDALLEGSVTLSALTSLKLDFRAGPPGEVFARLDRLLALCARSLLHLELEGYPFDPEADAAKFPAARDASVVSEWRLPALQSFLYLLFQQDAAIPRIVAPELTRLFPLHAGEDVFPSKHDAPLPFPKLSDLCLGRISNARILRGLQRATTLTALSCSWADEGTDESLLAPVALRFLLRSLPSLASLIMVAAEGDSAAFAADPDSGGDAVLGVLRAVPLDAAIDAKSLEYLHWALPCEWLGGITFPALTEARLSVSAAAESVPALKDFLRAAPALQRLSLSTPQSGDDVARPAVAAVLTSAHPRLEHVSIENPGLPLHGVGTVAGAVAPFRVPGRSEFDMYALCKVWLERRELQRHQPWLLPRLRTVSVTEDFFEPAVEFAVDRAAKRVRRPAVRDAGEDSDGEGEGRARELAEKAGPEPSEQSF